MKKSNSVNDSNNSQSSQFAAKPSTVFKAAIDSRIDLYPAFDLFRRACKKNNFYVQEVTTNSICAIHKQSYFLSFFNQIKSKTMPVTKVKLQVATYQQDSLHLLVAKGIEGSAKQSSNLVASFKSLFEKWITEKLQTEKKVSQQALESSLKIRRVQLFNYEEFTRQLNDPSCTLGQQLDAASIEWNRSDRIMDQIKEFIVRTLDVMSIQHRVGYSSEIYLHYKPMAEKFLFTRFAHKLSQEYIVKLAGQEQEFLEKIATLKGLSKQEIMEKFDVKEKFRLVGEERPYNSAVILLKKMLTAVTPIEKLNCLLTVLSAMKTAALSYSRGKEELITMDDQLPVLIYVVSQMDESGFCAQIEMLKDYTEDTVGLENEVCVLTHIESAVLYLTYELIMQELIQFAVFVKIYINQGLN